MMRLLQKVRPKKHEDTSCFDQLVYYSSTALLLVFSLIGASQIYGPRPLQCWLPAHLKDQWEKYVTNLCHVEGTYFVGRNESFPMDLEERKERVLLYYQWVPFILGGQMLLAMLPLAIWKGFSRRSGVPLTAVFHVLFRMESGRQKTVLALAEEITQRLKFANSKLLTRLYLLFKALNVIVSVVQVILLGVFMENDYSFGGSMIGWELLSDLWKGRTWEYSGHFPRITYCDLAIREQGGQMVPWTFQCLLPYNELNEVFCIILWFWFVFVSIVAILDFLYWIIQTWVTKNSVKAMENDILQTLNETRDICPDDCDCGHFDYAKSALDAFLQDQAEGDGAFVYEMVKARCNKFRASIFILAEWDMFSPQFQQHAKDSN